MKYIYKEGNRFRVRIPVAGGKRYTVGTYDSPKEAVEARDEFIGTAVDNERILLFADYHAPYQHRDAFAFLTALEDAVKPTLVINGGDEIDSHSLGFWPKHPDLLNATDELIAGRECMRELAALFPEVLSLESNHTSRAYRTAMVKGIPKDIILPYAKLLGIKDYNWTWHKDYVLELPDGSKVYMAHHKGVNVEAIGKSLGCNYVSAHQHKKAGINYWQSINSLNWSMSLPCLIDEHSKAFGYDSISTIRPILGAAVIIDSVPSVVPMRLDKHGRWDGKVNL